MPQKSRGKGNEKHTLKEATTAQPQNAEVRRKSQKQGGEEEAQSNDWEIGKSEGESEEKGSLKTKARKLKFSGKPKSHTVGALTPLVRTRHVAMMCVALPLCIKCGAKSQEPCSVSKPFIFWWSSWHTTTTIEHGGQLMGLTNSPSLDGLIKCTYPPWHVTDEHKKSH